LESEAGKLKDLIAAEWAVYLKSSQDPVVWPYLQNGKKFLEVVFIDMKLKMVSFKEGGKSDISVFIANFHDFYVNLFNKLKENLDPESNEETFIENLINAISSEGDKIQKTLLTIDKLVKKIEDDVKRIASEEIFEEWLGEVWNAYSNPSVYSISALSKNTDREILIKVIISDMKNKNDFINNGHLYNFYITLFREVNKQLYNKNGQKSLLEDVRDIVNKMVSERDEDEIEEILSKIIKLVKEVENNNEKNVSPTSSTVVTVSTAEKLEDLSKIPDLLFEIQFNEDLKKLVKKIREEKKVSEELSEISSEDFAITLIKITLNDMAAVIKKDGKISNFYDGYLILFNELKLKMSREIHETLSKKYEEGLFSKIIKIIYIIDLMVDSEPLIRELESLIIEKLKLTDEKNTDSGNDSNLDQLELVCDET